jgi:hypothetical protein
MGENSISPLSAFHSWTSATDPGSDQPSAIGTPVKVKEVPAVLERGCGERVGLTVGEDARLTAHRGEACAAEGKAHSVHRAADFGRIDPVMARPIRLQFPRAVYHPPSHRAAAGRTKAAGVPLEQFCPLSGDPETTAQWLRLDRLLGEHGIREDRAAGIRLFERRMEARRVEPGLQAQWKPPV